MCYLYFFLLFFLISSCRDVSKQITHFRGFSHAIPYHIQIGRSLSLHEKRKIHSLIDKVFTEVDQIYNHWNPNSELSSFNSSPIQKKILLSEELFAILSLAKEFSILTEGKFDPTLGTIIHAWKQDLPKEIEPSPSHLETLSSGWDLLRLQENSGYKEKEKITIDLDGMVKGYFVDRLVALLLANNYSHLYVEWGGDIRTVNKHPQGREWCILLPTMQKTTSPFFISLRDGGLATSGDYEQCWNIAGTTYYHIIDPGTKMAKKRSATSIAAVTIYAPNCALADALATACMTFSSKELSFSWIKKIKKNMPNIGCWILDYQGEILSTFPCSKENSHLLLSKS